MSTQRRVVRGKRAPGTELTGAGFPASIDAGETELNRDFRRVRHGLTASSSFFRKTELATNSLDSSSCCEWRVRHGFQALRYAALLDMSERGRRKAAPAESAGFFPEQLPSNSPLPARVAPLQSAAPLVPPSLGSGTERQHGQGNMHFKHAARNTACDFGRRSAR
jgi:hypothetical protein